MSPAKEKPTAHRRGTSNQRTARTITVIKRKHLISTAIGVVALAALSGGALAATNDHRGEGASDLRSRVSEILGIDADELGDAFSEARSELKDEAMAERDRPRADRRRPRPPRGWSPR